MSTRIPDLLALSGFLAVLLGVYLWLGLPAMLITFGLSMIVLGWRMPEEGEHESHQENNPAP